MDKVHKFLLPSAVNFQSAAKITYTVSRSKGPLLLHASSQQLLPALIATVRDVVDLSPELCHDVKLKMELARPLCQLCDVIVAKLSTD